MNFRGKQKKELIKMYHTRTGALGLGDELKREMLWRNFKVQSSRDLTVEQLVELCSRLYDEGNIPNVVCNDDYKELDKWRKRVMAAIGGYLLATHRQGGSDIIKAIACRAAEYKRFNDIPLSKLRAVYGEFVRQTKALKSARNVVVEDLQELASLN
jgi:hypothetical protein